MDQNQNTHPVFVTKIEDGTFVVASIETPRFCVGARTEKEAIEKAQRALDYFTDPTRERIHVSPRETRVISPVFEQERIRERVCA